MVRVESLEGEKGDMVEIKDVCMIVDGDKMSVGKPTLASAKVTGEVVEQGRGEKLIIFKHRRRKGLPQDQRSPSELHGDQGKRNTAKKKTYPKT